MDKSELRKKFAALWQETFHDSDEYVKLVFDAYFNPDYVAYEEHDGELVAALMGVPYQFGNEDNNVSGLYLCGLATKPQYRSRGIMTRLLVDINNRAAQAGFAFTFLIPADAGLRRYYYDRDYVNAFYRVIDNYTSLHDFNMDYESELAAQKEKVADLKRRYYATLTAAYIDSDSKDCAEVKEKIRGLIMDAERTQQDFQIIHNAEDIDTLIKENIIDRGTIYYVLNGAGEATAAAFTSLGDTEVNIHKLYSSDLGSRYKILDLIKTKNPERGIRHYVSSLEMDRKALWQRTYGSIMGDAPQVATISVTERVYSLASHAKVYGMARILNLYEILKFQANIRRDLKYSILVKCPDIYTVDHIETKNGEVKVKKIPLESLSPDRRAHIMSRHDVGEILFRRRDTDNLITEAFGIPSINGAIALLLD